MKDKPKTTIICPVCGVQITVTPELAARTLGAAGRGPCKRRQVDYSVLAKRSQEARRRNKAARTGD